MLHVCLLGQFKVLLDEEIIEIASRPAQCLFAYLILNPGIEHRRERLAGLFWPDSSESNARNNLRQALWRVRKALNEEGDVEDGFLIVDSFTLAFNPKSEYWLDAALLEKDFPSDKPTDELIEIVSSYEGELLPGFYDDWIVLAREHLQASFERKMQYLMEHLVQEKRWRDVLEWGERWIALGHVPETAYRALMIAHGGLGDTSSVASVYRRCEDALESELGVEPSEDTRITYARLSAGEKLLGLYPFEATTIPDLSPAIQEIPEPRFPDFLEPRLSPTGEKETVFVAREHELGQLEAFLQEMMEGRGKVVFVTGDAGGGKTALIHEFAQRSQDVHPELLVTFGDCNALTGIGDPYLPFRESLGLLAGELESKWSGGYLTQEEARRLWKNLPYTILTIVEEGPDLLNSFINGAGLLAHGKAYNPDETGWLFPLEELISRKASQMAISTPEQQDLFSQYSKVILSLAHHQPILLLLDDLQWLDLGSASLLFHLGRKVEEGRILILGAYRPSEIAVEQGGIPHPLVKISAEFKRRFGPVQVDLEAMEQEEGRHFVEALLDTEPNQLGEGFRDSLCRQTSGHPLFTIELLRAMEGRGDILKDMNGVWSEGPNLEWERLPARVEGVVEERIGRLNSGLQRLLTVASVEGEEFTAEVLAGVLGLDPKEVVEHLSNELDKKHRLVIAQGIRRLDDQRISCYRFRHTLFQKHLYNQLDPIERANLHEEIGRLLEKIYGRQVDEVAVALASHFNEAGILDKAVTYFERAGNRAKQLSADEDAIGHFYRGIELLQSMPDTLERIQRELGLQIALGAPLITTKGYGAPEVQAAFARARELSIQVLDPPQLFPLIYGLRSFYLMRAEHETAREIAEQLIHLAQQEQEPPLFLQAHEALGTTLFYLGELPLARENLEKGIELYNPQQHQHHAFLYGQDPGVACQSYLALVLWSMGYFERASQRRDEALHLAREQGHPFSLALACDFAASFCVLCRDIDSVRSYAEEAMALSQTHHFPMWLAMGKVLSGWALVEQGEVDRGIERIHEGLEAWQGTGATLGTPNFLGLMAEALIKTGRLEDGLGAIEQALKDVQSTHERIHEAELYRLQGELYIQRGAEASKIEASFQQALDIARHQGAKGTELRTAVSLSRFWLEMGHQEQATALLSEICPSFEDGEDSIDLRTARAILEQSSSYSDG